jgi:predicted metal-dependent hydrolase
LGQLHRARRNPAQPKTDHAPPSIDYVVVHELCHLVEHNHGKAFYDLLSRVMPDWQERREKIEGYDFG